MLKRYQTRLSWLTSQVTDISWRLQSVDRHSCECFSSYFLPSIYCCLSAGSVPDECRPMIDLPPSSVGRGRKRSGVRTISPMEFPGTFFSLVTLPKYYGGRKGTPFSGLQFMMQSVPHLSATMLGKGTLPLRPTGSPPPPRKLRRKKGECAKFMGKLC